MESDFHAMIGKEKTDKLIDILSELTECILEKEKIECITKYGK